jgi:hypothetical protein
MHQPLHSITGYSTALPEGDRGGNLIKINVPQLPFISNLHAMWDSAGGLFLENSPLSPSQSAALIANASSLIADLPSAGFPQFNPSEFAECWADGGGYSEPCKDVLTKWSNESYDIATTVAYPGIVQNMTITQAYIDLVQHTSRRQIALAGYRLANIIKTVANTMPAGGFDLKSGAAEASLPTGLTSLEKGMLAALILTWMAIGVVIATRSSKFRGKRVNYAAMRIATVHNDNDDGDDDANSDDDDDITMA